MHSEKGVEKPFHTDWDVGIAIDALNAVDTYDTFTLVSGDGDYSLLIEELKERQKYGEVITFASTASRLLYVSAHSVVHIDEDQLYFQEYGSGKA